MPAAGPSHWVNWRLNAWRETTEIVCKSPTQLRARRAETAKREQDARRAVASARSQELRAARSTLDYQTAKQACLDQILNRNRNTRLHRKNGRW